MSDDRNWGLTQLQRAWSWLVSLRIGVPGIWLLLLYFSFGLLVIFSLSAYQLQFAIKSSASPDGKPVGMWQVLQVHSEWKAHKRLSATLDAQITTNRQELGHREHERDELTLSDELATHDCRTTVAKLRTYLWQIDVPNIKNSESLNKCEQDTLNELKHSLDRVGADFQIDENKFDRLVNSITTGLATLQKNKSDLRHLEINIENLQNEITKSANKADETRATILTLLNSNALGIASGDFLNALSYLEAKENLPLVPSFSIMPSDMLTLILVMSMGALGGTITLTRNYLLDKSEEPNDPPTGAASYLFRPLLGAITALAIFILAKAGVLIIATPTPGGGAPLSPFFISFLGIVSGLLADSALDTIQRTGKGWFSAASEVDRERWAFGLKGALQTEAASRVPDSNLDQLQDDIAIALDVTPKTLESWIDETIPVPAAHQALLAAYLRETPRKLFSDMRNGHQPGQPDARKA